MEQPNTVIFTDDGDTVDTVVKEGVDVDGVITTYEEQPDPRDNEHTIFVLGYEYEVDSQVFRDQLRFSINTDHISYGYAGALYNTPKFKYSLDDFKLAMQPGQILKVRALPRPPYWFFVAAHGVLADIMQYDAVWM